MNNYKEKLQFICNILKEYKVDEDTYSALEAYLSDSSSSDELVGQLQSFERALKEYKDDSFAQMRNIFIYISKDLRLFVINVCIRIYDLQHLDRMSQDKKNYLIKQTIDIHIPVCEKLGMWHLKEILCDLAFAEFIPEKFNALSQKQTKSVEYLESQKKEFIAATISFSGKVKILIRKKSFDSIFNFSQIGKKIRDYRMVFLKCLVNSEKECYEFLFLLHEKFHVYPGSFRDYISTPKQNGYKALHTLIIDSNGKWILVQIITELNHEHVRHGILLHWDARSDGLTIANLKGKNFAWYEKIQTGDVSYDSLQKSILVSDQFSKIHDIPEGSTALDLIYQSFPDEAPHLSQVIINNNVAPFQYILTEGDIVKAKYSTDVQVSITWMDFTNTYFAKNRIQVELQNRDDSQKIKIGRNLLQQEFDMYELGLFPSQPKYIFEKVLSHTDYTDFSLLLIDIGQGSIDVKVVFLWFQKYLNSTEDKRADHFHLTFETNKKTSIKKLYSIADKKNIYLHDVRIKKIAAKQEYKIEGDSSDRSDTEIFIESIKHNLGISKVTLAMSNTMKCSIFMWILASFGSWIIIFFLINAEVWNLVPSILIYFLIVPALFINYFMYRFLLHYCSSYRKNYMVLGGVLLLNILATILYNIIFFIRHTM